MTECLDRPRLLFTRYRFHSIRKRSPFVVQFEGTGERGVLARYRSKQMALFHPLNNADKPTVRCSSVNTSGYASTDICQIREAFLQASRFAIGTKTEYQETTGPTNTPWKQSCFLFIRDASTHNTFNFLFLSFPHRTIYLWTIR